MLKEAQRINDIENQISRLNEDITIHKSISEGLNKDKENTLNKIHNFIKKRVELQTEKNTLEDEIRQMFTIELLNEFTDGDDSFWIKYWFFNKNESDVKQEEVIKYLEGVKGIDIERYNAPLKEYDCTGQVSYSDIEIEESESYFIASRSFTKDV